MPDGTDRPRRAAVDKRCHHLLGIGFRSSVSEFRSTCITASQQSLRQLADAGASESSDTESFGGPAVVTQRLRGRETIGHLPNSLDFRLPWSSRTVTVSQARQARQVHSGPRHRSTRRPGSRAATYNLFCANRARVKNYPLLRGAERCLWCCRARRGLTTPLRTTWFQRPGDSCRYGGRGS